MPTAREGESTRGGLRLALVGDAFLMVFYAFETRFQSRYFA